MGQQTIILDGKSLTIQQVAQVAEQKAEVEISQEAMERLRAARELVLNWDSVHAPVYGFNTGVGINKDRQVHEKQYEQFNRSLIFSHCIGVKPEADEKTVRAAMLIRLNTLLLGYTGVQPEIAQMYKRFLNEGIHPVIPERASVGVADLGNLAHIGLAMIGEGEVIYRGKRMNASEALKKAGIKSIVLGPKDGLAIASSNAFAAAKASLLLNEVKQLIDLSDIVFALSLEGLNGNISPLDESVLRIRPFPGNLASAGLIKACLEGSYLSLQHLNRPLQDPLSFRGAFAVHGAVRDAIDYTEQNLLIQLNSSDDNPCVLVDEQRILSCSNYEVTTWVLAIEMLGQALAHLSKISCFRTIKLSSPNFSGLPRFLSPDNGQNVLAFSTIQKTFAALDAEIRHLSNPINADFIALSGEIEDHANNSVQVVDKTAKMVDNLYYILGIEAMHAAQAIDLRKDISLGHGTEVAYKMIRQEVPFLDADRNLSVDIEKMYKLLKSGEICRAVRDKLGGNLLGRYEVS
ncbi:HAL/PAL/TAL family ammonia-lyase [Aeribacillus sp. SP014]